MKVREYRAIFINKLMAIYDAIEAESFFYLVLENKMQLKRIDLALQPDLAFSQEDLATWDFILTQLLEQIPIQYLLKTTVFYGLDFEVNDSVLIPRPETEELVAWILDTQPINESKAIDILDIGTGSGCIAITLAKNLPHANLAAIDVSEKALTTAQKNALINDVEVTFYHQNILETEQLQQNFDIIVSNPPYVRHLEKAEIRKNVLEHEPHLALFVEDHDQLLFYRKIASLALIYLKPNGQLFFEINQYLGKEMVALLSDMGFENVELRQDIYGNDRMIGAQKSI